MDTKDFYRGKDIPNFQKEVRENVCVMNGKCVLKSPKMYIGF